MSRKRTTQKTYQYYEKYIGNRPHCTSVAVVYRGAMSPYVANALVDTGADSTVLPAGFAIAVGLPLPAATPYSTLGGPILVHKVTSCELEVEGQRLKGLTVLFDPSGTLAPILGRDALLSRCEFGFDVNEWRWDR